MPARPIGDEDAGAAVAVERLRPGRSAVGHAEDNLAKERSPGAVEKAAVVRSMRR